MILKKLKKIAVGYMLVNHPVITKVQSLIKKRQSEKLFSQGLSVDFICQIGILGRTIENFIWLIKIKGEVFFWTPVMK